MKKVPPPSKNINPTSQKPITFPISADQFEEKVRALQERFRSSKIKNPLLNESDHKILTLCFYFACRYRPLKKSHNAIVDRQQQAEQFFHKKGSSGYDHKEAQRRALEVMGWSDGKVGKKTRLHPNKEWSAVSYYRFLLDPLWGFHDETTGKPYTQARAAERTFKELKLKSSTCDAEKEVQKEIEKHYPKLSNVALSDKKQIQKILKMEHPGMTLGRLRIEFPRLNDLNWNEEKQFLNQASKKYSTSIDPTNAFTPDKDQFFEDLDMIIQDFIEDI